MTKLSEDEVEEIRKDVNLVDWGSVCFYRKLSEEFIREFADRINWCYASCYQKLSEGFIREFGDKVYWVGISYCQNLSEEFIIEFYDRVDWKKLLEYKKIDKNIFNKLDRGKKLYLMLKWRKVYEEIK